MIKATRQLLCEKNMLDRASDVTHEKHYGSGKAASAHQFDVPTLIYFGDGVEHDFMDDVRDCLVKHVKLATSFTLRRQWTHRETLDVARDIVKTCSISYGDYEHTPRRFWALFEVLATCDAALALVMGDHFAFAHLAATRTTPRARAQILLDGEDVGRLGAVAVLESHINITGPCLLDARTLQLDKCVMLSGTGKFAVVNGTTAKWAFVIAQVSKSKKTHFGRHGFFVRLRNDQGEPMPNISIEPIKKDGVDSLGMAVIHFNHVPVGIDFIATPSFWNDQTGEIVASADSAEAGRLGEATNSRDNTFEKLLVSRRLIAGSIYSGTLKRAFTNIANFVAKRCVLSAFGEQTYYLLGLQHIQTPICVTGSGVFAVQYAWQQIAIIFGDATKSPTAVQHQQLHSVLHLLIKELTRIETLSSATMAQHALFDSSGLRDIRLVIGCLAEGDITYHARVAGKEIVNATSSSEVSWFDRAFLSLGGNKKIGGLRRTLRNPGFSILLPAPDMHAKFFHSIYLDMRERVRLHSTIEQRLYGPEDAWYYWNTGASSKIARCGEALGEAFVTKEFAQCIKSCQDPPTQSYLAQLFLFYSLSRIAADREHLGAIGLISDGQVKNINTYLDKSCVKVAPSLHKAAIGLRVPDAFLAPSHVGIDAYWSIPGTITNVERGDSVVATPTNQRKSERKADQEKIVESEEETDLLHGLGDSPPQKK